MTVFVLRSTEYMYLDMIDRKHQLINRGCVSPIQNLAGDEIAGKVSGRNPSPKLISHLRSRKLIRPFGCYWLFSRLELIEESVRLAGVFAIDS